MLIVDQAKVLVYIPKIWGKSMMVIVKESFHIKQQGITNEARVRERDGRSIVVG